MKKFNMKEPLMVLEEFIKAGRLHVALLGYDRKDEAVVGELIIDFTDKAKPILHIKNPDGEVVPVLTESDRLFNEFLENFIEVSVDRTVNYEPSLWFMIRTDDGNDNWSYDIIKQHFDFAKANKNSFKPYMMQTFKNKQRELLLPFITTKEIYYDMGKLIADERITDFDKIVEMLYNLIIDIRDNLQSIITEVSESFNALELKLNQENDRQNLQIAALEESVRTLNNKLDDLNNKLDEVAGTTEKRIRPKELRVGGQSNMVYPVRLKYVNGTLSVPGGKEFFMAPILLTIKDANRSCLLKIGHNHTTNSPDFFSGDKGTHYVYDQTVLNNSNAKFYFYDVNTIGSGDYVVMLRGGTTYTLWSKYIEDIQITNNNTAIGSYEPHADTVLNKNPNLTNSNNLGASTVLTFNNSVQVTKSVIVGNKNKNSFSLEVEG